MADTEVLADGFVFPESPRWRDGRLWLSDFFDRTVVAVELDGSRTIEASVPAKPGGLGWLPDGRLLVVSQTDRRILRREPDGQLSEHADLTNIATGDLNDMVVDAAGRGYVGNLGFDPHAWFAAGGSFRDAPSSALACVESDGTVRAAAHDLRVPNGGALTTDGRLLLVAESFAGRVIAFDVDPHDGALSGRRIWAALPGRMPDGIALDADGDLWVADARTSACVRVRRGGQLLEVVATTQPCFACALGGADGRTLFCVTAPSTRESDAVLARHGRVEVIVVDVPAAS